MLKINELQIKHEKMKTSENQIFVATLNVAQFREILQEVIQTSTAIPPPSPPII
ncbi:MAG: hypothetical protein LBU83_10810 [Bacteroidales bacterium]|jgi:hypothetical protein|nr:hypothetical protein [Bacteroidales bacterium]